MGRWGQASYRPEKQTGGKNHQGEKNQPESSPVVGVNSGESCEGKWGKSKQASGKRGQ